MDPHELTASVKDRALEIGFSAVGVCDLSPNAHAEHLSSWLSSGMAGTMTYMHRQKDRRLNPGRILSGATHAVVLMRTHFTADPPRTATTGLVAKYARGPDYHVALREPLNELISHMRSLGGRSTVARAYVDAGPVPERELAQRAGLGWIGKNTMLIHPKLGSHSFLATVLTNLELTADEPFSRDRCGSCTRCLEACPTRAIQPNRMLDSRLCISYLTIEHRGEIPERLQPLLGDRVFGCDICQDVCPWNVKFARPASDPVLSLDPNRSEEPLTKLVDMSPEAFASRFKNTPLERAGIDGIRRNALIAQKNQ